MSRPSSSRGPGALVYLGAVLLLIGAIVAGAWFAAQRSANGTDADGNAPFAQAMASGKTFYDKGDPGKAISAFQTALSMNPANPDVHINLANAFLLANQPGPVAIHAAEALRFEPGNGAAHYLLGCSALRQNQYSNAVQSLQEAKAADPTVNAVSFQLGRAFFGWGKLDDAAAQLREVAQFDTNHPSAFYLLSQVLLRQGQREEAVAALASHQRIAAGKTQAADDPAIYERCRYTEIVAPFPLEQPARDGIALKFVDDTARAFGGNGAKLHGAFGLVDINRRGWNDLLVANETGVQLLWNSNGVFTARTAPLAVATAANATQVLVGDLQNDRYEDAVIVGPAGVSVLRFATNGVFSDVTAQSGLRAAKASGSAGALGDLDFTGKLGLMLATADGQLRSFTNLGSGTFRERKGDPFGATNVIAVAVDDWSNDDLPDVLLTRRGQPPLLLANVRGSGLVATNPPADWPAARSLAVGDLNNDLRNDVALVTDKAVEIFFGGLREPLRLPAKGNRIRHLRALDLDNDGWLDLVSWGADGVRVWRNRGNAGFHEVTAELGLGVLATSDITQLAAADLDADCDIDLVIEVAGAGLKMLRNDGGNANGMLKLRLLGNRSNASALGVKTELSAGGWHGLRSVQTLPVEIGVGKRKQLDSVSIRWFDTRQDTTEVAVSCEPMSLFELVLPTGSCPYLYTWDGHSNRFVTDILGAAPLGLPVAPGRFIDADPDELVRLGDETDVVPKDGDYVVHLTEELREILYLDQARLVVADRPAGQEVHTTGKLVPGKPFPKHELVALGGRVPLRHAEDLSGNDVTSALRTADGRMVSPASLRGPQYRGLAEPHGVVLEFAPLADAARPVLALTGWLRFGGGMANIAGSHSPDFPFPFPVLEAGTATGWQKVDVTVGAPAGKTKTILVDLAGKLPAGTTRLRLTQSFEIHWDRIALFTESGKPSVHEVPPSATDLHWRGYSEFADLPWTQPLTPVYDRVKSKPAWTITPSGWVTRYGPVDDLLAGADNGLVLVAAGDELTLRFAADRLPPKPSGMVREFFLSVTGWDKDADYHVVRGDEVGPLPWRGMDDQRYGSEPRPAFPSDALHERFGSRWIGPKTFVRRDRPTSKP